MSLSDEDQADCCPHCRKPFEIVYVKFRLNGTATVACCPNCAMVSTDVLPVAELQIIVEAKKQLATVMAFWQKVGAPMMESTIVRFRHAPALLVGTLTTAASLRHAIRTYGGFSREEGAGALVAVPIVALAIVFFRRKRQLRRKRQSKALPRGGASDAR
jgi:hypothetical protein